MVVNRDPRIMLLKVGAVKEFLADLQVKGAKKNVGMDGEELD